MSNQPGVVEWEHFGGLYLVTYQSQDVADVFIEHNVAQGHQVVSKRCVTYRGEMTFEVVYAVNGRCSERWGCTERVDTQEEAVAMVAAHEAAHADWDAI